MSQNALLTILALITLATFFLSTFSKSVRKIGHKTAFPEIQFRGAFFYSSVLHFLRIENFNYLSLDISVLNTLLSLFFGSLSAILLIQGSFSGPVLFLLAFTLLILFLLIGNLLSSLWSNAFPDTATTLATPVASLLLAFFLPVTLPFSYLYHKLKRADSPKKEHEAEIIRNQFLQLLQTTHPTNLGEQEKKILESVVPFRDRIAREVMVPRGQLFSLESETPISVAANKLQEEGYSRVPVYKGHIDNILGVLMYKDLLSHYMEYEKTGNVSVIEQPIASLLKPVLYTPETKKISNLLQEFRAKATHLAIVVDEYGGTEGLITIEDILEQVVGEIADEYDEEDILYNPLPTGGWIVDAKMGINDIEEELGIKIPSQADYDTLGGYIYHRAGSIPQQGFTIEHDHFQIKVLRSSDRCIDKVKLIPTEPKEENRWT